MLIEHERPDPVAVLASARRARARVRPARAASGSSRSRSFRRPGVLELRQDAVDAVHVRGRAGSRSSRRCRRRRAGTDPSARATARPPRPARRSDRAGRDAVGVLEQLVARQARRASALVAPHVSTRRRAVRASDMCTNHADGGRPGIRRCASGAASCSRSREPSRSWRSLLSPRQRLDSMRGGSWLERAGRGTAARRFTMIVVADFPHGQPAAQSGVRLTKWTPSGPSSENVSGAPGARSSVNRGRFQRSN